MNFSLIVPGLYRASDFDSDFLRLRDQGEDINNYWVFILGSGKYYWVKASEIGMNYWTEAAGEDREFSSMKEAFIWVDMELDGGKNKEEISYLVDRWGQMRFLLYHKDHFIKGFRTAEQAYIHLHRIQSCSVDMALKYQGYRVLYHSDRTEF